ncbi:hypothetical protein EPUL_005359, partial [Erysiphe pulchra]
MVETILSCSTREDWCIRQDHIPIEIKLMAGIQNLEPKRYAHSKADINKIKEVIHQSGWDKAAAPLEALQSALAKALNLHCPRARPSRFANPKWSPEAFRLLNETRRARRLAIQSGSTHDNYRYNSLKKNFKKEMRRLRRLSWRKSIADITSNSEDKYKTGLWKLSRWSKKSSNIQQGLPHLPPLRRDTMFFPSNLEADLSDLEENQRPKRSVIITTEVKPEEVECILSQLPRVTNRIMKAAEEHNMLPWAQMGARKNRSTISALQLLTSIVQTAWNGSPDCIVSMLCLDIKGAFENVSVERFLWILRTEGFSNWIINFVRSFMTQRKTKIHFPGYSSEWIKTKVGIPQGSNLSPILFLFYISELLESLQQPTCNYMAFGLVDDTTLHMTGCLAWAKRYGAAFAPEKHQLVHFTKKHKSADLQESIQLNGTCISPRSEVKVLEILVDSRLRWGAQVSQAAQKGHAEFNA